MPYLPCRHLELAPTSRVGAKCSLFWISGALGDSSPHNLFEASNTSKRPDLSPPVEDVLVVQHQALRALHIGRKWIVNQAEAYQGTRSALRRRQLLEKPKAASQVTEWMPKLPTKAYQGMLLCLVPAILLIKINNSHSEQCDERGSPCANCIARESGTSCRYPNSSITPARATSCSSSSEANIELLIDSVSKPRRLLDLELIHRWSTTTYKSICTLPEDEPCIQVKSSQASAPGFEA